MEILCEANSLYLKSKGYVSKCDDWGVWIAVSKMEKNSVAYSESLSEN